MGLLNFSPAWIEGKREGRMTKITLYHSEGGYAIKLRSDDTTAFKLAIETLKSFVPAIHRSYHPPTKEWRVDRWATSQFYRWLSYVRSWLHAKIEWLDYGEDAGDSAGEWAPQQPPRAQPRDAHSTLYLLPSAPATRK